MRFYAPVILATAAVLAGAVYLYYSEQSGHFRASMRFVQDEPLAPARQPSDQPEALDAQTLARLVTTRPVLRAAADQITDETESSLRSNVEVSVDPGTRIVELSVRDDVAEQAAANAGIVFGSFEAVREGILENHIQSVNDELRRAIAAETSGAVMSRLRAKQRQLAVTGSLAGTDLVVVEGPETPMAREGPDALTAAAIAFCGAGVVGFLAALLAGQGRARARNATELAAWVGTEPLAEVPRNRGWLGRYSRRNTAAEAAAYQIARVRLHQATESGQSPVILVTGAGEAEGKTTATVQLGKAFADAGLRVLLVDADLYRQDLGSTFKASPGAGLYDLADDPSLNSADLLIPLDIAKRGRVKLLTAGRPSKRPDTLTAQEIQGAFDLLRRSGNEIVLIDCPMLGGAAEAQVMASTADHVVIVARLHRLTSRGAGELGALLSRIGVRACGLLVIGKATATGSRRPHAA